jgi:hypothetical protein
VPSVHSLLNNRYQFSFDLYQYVWMSGRTREQELRVVSLSVPQRFSFPQFKLLKQQDPHTPDCNCIKRSVFPRLYPISPHPTTAEILRHASRGIVGHPLTAIRSIPSFLAQSQSQGLNQGAPSCPAGVGAQHSPEPLGLAAAVRAAEPEERGSLLDGRALRGPGCVR